MRISKGDLVYTVIMIILIVAAGVLWGYIWGRWYAMKPVSATEITQQCKEASEHYE